LGTVRKLNEEDEFETVQVCKRNAEGSLFCT